MLTVAIEAGDPLVDAFRQGLRQLGYVERENFTFEFRSAKGQAALLPSLARELVHLNVDVIVTGSDAAIRAARDATNRIPIVMAGSA
jgi:putative ABC transport system substrate-binding protein